ncbi:type VII secretion protein EssB [Oceanobacillus bengalensis]|uniref:Type VII secretion protein EssB n=1 Tax=Oceanobacillus bengalensis TaxID=1435466 RepID=A0A494Z2U6_9BACI|nr:type VII secretion protein EssB [Oceanobacillus bengalensis]RKQ16840.1 type VII secretion protein EssB [Oceanobacillus bengalensis]
MKEVTINFEKNTYHFVIEENNWKLTLPKSQTKVKDIRQMDIMLNPSDFFTFNTVQEKEDSFLLTYEVNQEDKRWEQVKKLNRNEKLRLLCNVGKLDQYLSSRITFFLHPDNLVFDDNLIPRLIYRGIRDIVPPFHMNENEFLKQYKCLVIALFTKKYSFDQLYNGSLQNAKDTEFERKIIEIEDLKNLKDYLFESYLSEQKKTERTMEIVPIKRFRLFKQLSIIMIIVSIFLAAPLIYFGFIKIPFQENVLASHGEFLANDYGGVISTLQGEDPDSLPMETKYILAQSYINVENLSDQEKEVILKNVSLKSDENYLLYWIYNGLGRFDDSIEKAKYMDDPQLVMYSLIKKIEQAKNNPDLTGTERDKLVNDLQEELERYIKDYDLNVEETEVQESPLENENTETKNEEEVESTNTDSLESHEDGKEKEETEES